MHVYVLSIQLCTSLFYFKIFLLTFAYNYIILEKALIDSNVMFQH